MNWSSPIWTLSIFLAKRIYVSLNPTGVLHIKTVETCHQGHNSIKDMVGRMNLQICMPSAARHNENTSCVLKRSTDILNTWLPTLETTRMLPTH